MGELLSAAKHRLTMSSTTNLVRPHRPSALGTTKGSASLVSRSISCSAPMGLAAWLIACPGTDRCLLSGHDEIDLSYGAAMGKDPRQQGDGGGMRPSRNFAVRAWGPLGSDYLPNAASVALTRSRSLPRGLCRLVNACLGPEPGGHTVYRPIGAGLRAPERCFLGTP